MQNVKEIETLINKAAAERKKADIPSRLVMTTFCCDPENLCDQLLCDQGQLVVMKNVEVVMGEEHGL